MSDELSTTAWAHPEDMEYWRGEVAGFLKKLADSGHTSSRSLEAMHPDDAARAMYLLQQGKTIYAVCKETGLSDIMVRRTASHYLGPLEKWRPELVQRLTKITFDAAEALSMKLDQIMSDPEELRKVSIDKLAVVLGIANDKLLNHHGAATTVVEHRSGPSIEDAMKFREEIRQRVEMGKGKVIDV